MTNSENRTVEETTREDIPLKTGTKQSKWYNCNEDCMGGSKFINVAFGVLTIIVTIALIVQIYYGDYQVVPHGSVATDSLECSRVGTQILKQGGKAVDAAIASAFCLAVVAPHLTGLDAEGQVLIYSHRTRISPDLVDFSGSNVISDRMPRLVLGLAYIHQQYATMPWKSLVEPSIGIARNGYVVSKMLSQAINRAHAQDLYGRQEPGQLLQHETLANTLEKIGNIPEKELYSYIDSSNHPVQSQAVSSSFYNYDVFVPSLDTIGPVLLVNLREIEEFNFTEVNTATTKRMIETTLRAYEEFNVTARFHEGTSTNIAVMDLDDDYVSFVTGMYDLFGSRELTIHGYVLDVKNKPKSCSRIPLILTDNKFICGKRLVFGANGVAQASQLVVNLIIGAKNATDGVEFPRFYLLDNATIAVEAAHSPKFQLELLEYLKAAHREPVLMPEPYYSSNAVEKLKDELSSHSDSRGGGIASRF
ncbi:glutathione hydrolase 7 [Dendroctonus ponderosae]|uniref:glutathione hydrolase 7 n=1 Tax=Dendroctonus ponderosae TaxID=77166 RepID=UPI002035EC7F|nr:glutathione hydrolase 7 [Dendroctonus ponderosae]